MKKNELKNFHNDGFGWVCRNCERELDISDNSAEKNHSRLMREGESESKTPHFSNKALAKWTNEINNELICPRCGVTEIMKNPGGME